MKPNNVLLKGSLALIILKLLEDNDKMYGYEITKKVKALSENNIQITEGALYPALHKLEADGLVQSTIETFENRSRKYYHLTKTGKKQIKFKLADFSSFLSDMQNILNLKPSV